MYLILPESMIIPEVNDRLEDSDFEDWLTAYVYLKHKLTGRERR
jgi:hypothetical protein